MTTRKLTYDDKVRQQEVLLPAENLWKHTDANEVKEVVNEHADAIDVIHKSTIILQPPTQDSAHALEAAAEINAAIIANPGRLIRIPTGRYLINETIRIRSENTGLIGEGWANPTIAGELMPDTGGGTKFILVTPNIEGIEVAPTFEGLAQVPSTRVVMIGNKLIDFSVDIHPDISNLITDKTKAGIALKQLRYLEYRGVYVTNTGLGLLISGVQTSFFSNFKTTVNNQTPELGEDSTVVRIQQHPIVGGSVNCWENRYINGNFGCVNGVRESAIKILRGDGEVFSGCYVAGGKLANIIMEGDAITQKSIVGIRFVAHRFDSGGANNPYRYQVLVRHQPGWTNSFNNIVFDKSCKWNMNSGVRTNGLCIESDRVQSFWISGNVSNIKNSFVRVKGNPANTFIDVSDVDVRNHQTPPITGVIGVVNGVVITTDKDNLPIEGLTDRWFIVGGGRRRIVSNTETTVTIESGITASPGDSYTIQCAALVDIEDVAGLTMRGFIARDIAANNTSIIELNGAIKTVSITGGQSSVNIPDIVNNAIVDDLSLQGNVSIYNGDKTKSWRNRYVAFTPEIEFSNPGSTPPSYSTQQGEIIIEGKIAHIRIILSLTSKGSSTGSVRVIGTSVVPWAASQLVVSFSNISQDITPAMPLITNNSGAIRISLTKMVDGINMTLQSSDIQNTTSIRLSGSYILP